MMIYPIISPYAKNLPVYVTGIGSKGNTENIVRANGLNMNQIYIVTNGSGILSCGKEEYKLCPGSCFVLRKGHAHTYKATDEDFFGIWICFGGSAAKTLTDMLAPSGFCVFTLESPRESIALFDKMLGLISEDAEYSQEEASALLYRMILNLMRLKNSAALSSHKKVQEAIGYIEINYDKEISLDDIADAAGMTKFALCRSFKNQFGTTVFSYLIRYRINAAKRLLTEYSDRTVSDIAHSVGFGDVCYFISAFKKSEGMTPAQFKKLWN